MDDDDLTIGKGRSSNAAIALAEEAARIQHKVAADLRERAATRAEESDEAAKEAAKQDTPDPQAKAEGKEEQGAEQQAATAENKEVPLAPDPDSTLDIEA